MATNINNIHLFQTDCARISRGAPEQGLFVHTFAESTQIVVRAGITALVNAHLAVSVNTPSSKRRFSGGRSRQRTIGHECVS